MLFVVRFRVDGCNIACHFRCVWFVHACLVSVGGVPLLYDTNAFDNGQITLQTYEHGRGLSFHFDKDEHIMAERGEMEHPLHSSILYITGSGASPRQSPTVVLQQLYNSLTRSAEPEDPNKCVLVFPSAGNFLVFDGALGHGVLDSVSEEVRMTLLINWWDHQPEVSFSQNHSPICIRSQITVLHLYPTTLPHGQSVRVT